MEAIKMTKKSLLLSLTALGSAIAVGAIVLSSSNGIGTSVFANDNQTQVQYTLTGWQLSKRTGLIYSWGDDYDGFIFTPTSGRNDIQLVVLLYANPQAVVDEVLPFAQDGTCVQISSTRTWEQIGDKNEYGYGDQGNFIADGMICFACKNFNENDYDFDALDNFANYSVSFDSWFAYNYMDTPGATSRDYNNVRVFANEAVRTFTSSQTYCGAPSYTSGVYLNNVYCVGMKIDISTISLTYSCSY